MNEHLAHPLLSSPKLASKGKVVTAEEAVQLIHNGDTVGISGFCGIAFAEALILALKERFTATGQPTGLTMIFAAGLGDGGERGLNSLAEPGLLKRVIGGHWGLTPKLGQLAIENRIEAYNLPQGVLTQLFRDAAAGKPGLLTTVGLGTFVDPRLGGGKVNARTTEEVVEVLTLHGREYLFYRVHPVQVALLRGTTADTDGNITMDREALFLDGLALATAAHNNGGIVIVQVERIADRGTLPPKQVKIPGVLVDCVVVARPEQHWQTFAERYSPAFSGEIRVPMQSIPPMEMSERKIIARRAAFELKPNSVVNLGIGMPEGIASVANEERILDYLTLTTEPGVIGGLPEGGLNFGAASNTQAIIDMPAQFDFYDGGGLDAAFLGMAQTDREGNVNVSRFGPKLAGAGGFINISQNAKELIFLGTFTAGGLQIQLTDGQMCIAREGKSKKFVEAVEQRTFSGAYARQRRQPVLYITERCVFRLTEAGPELTEIAPGLDLDKDILGQMGFLPLISPSLKEMDGRIFQPGPMNLKADLLEVPISERLVYDPAENLFFVNFEGLEIRDAAVIETIRREVETKLAGLGRKVYTVVNYDNFAVPPHLLEPYMEMVKDVTDRFYDKVTRYTTSAFLRMKLGEALQQRNVAPHIYESQADAHRHVRE
jgi:propionate CoA-transferase